MGVRSLGLSEGWHHIAVTFPAGGDSDDFLIYIDGQLQSSITLSGTVRTVDTGSGVAYIGRSAGGSSDYYGGVIDDLRVYNYQLSAGRVLELFEASVRLVARWEMDNDADDSAGARDGTLQGGAGFTTSAEVGSHALSLDGADDYVDLTSHAASFPQGDAARSIAGWFNADSGWQGPAFFAYGADAAGERFAVGADRTEASVGSARTQVGGAEPRLELRLAPRRGHLPGRGRLR